MGTFLETYNNRSIAAHEAQARFHEAKQTSRRNKRARLLSPPGEGVEMEARVVTAPEMVAWVPPEGLSSTCRIQLMSGFRHLDEGHARVSSSGACMCECVWLTHRMRLRLSLLPTNAGQTRGIAQMKSLITKSNGMFVQSPSLLQSADSAEGRGDIEWFVGVLCGRILTLPPSDSSMIYKHT